MADTTPTLSPLAVGIAEAAQLTSLSRRTIETLISRRRLPSRKIGKRRLILYADLRHLLTHDVPTVEAAQ